MLTELDIDDMLTNIRGLQNESPALKETVAKLTALVEEMNKAKAQQDAARERARKDRAGPEPRPHQPSVGGQASDLGRRYLATLKTQEDRLAEIGGIDARLDKEIEAKEKAAGGGASQCGKLTFVGCSGNVVPRHLTSPRIADGLRAAPLRIRRSHALISSTAASTRSGVVGASITGASL